MENISLKDREEMLKIAATDDFKMNLRTYLRSRQPLFYITTNDEKRFLNFMNNITILDHYKCYIWDCFKGLVDLETGEEAEKLDFQKEMQINDPTIILEYIIGHASKLSNENSESEDNVRNFKKNKQRGVIYILLDYFRFIDPSTTNPDPDLERRLKAISNVEGLVSTIITGPSYSVPIVLEKLVPVIDFPYPNKEEIKHSIKFFVDNLGAKIPDLKEKTEAMEEDLINSVSGLTFQEINSAFSKSIVSSKGWDLKTIRKEKRNIISKSGILEYYDKDVPITEIGGLKNLVNWILERKVCFSEDAASYGLVKPRGILIAGIPGCGKSLACKAIAHSWEMPLIRLDFGKLFSSHVGSSENNAREAIKTAEGISPCVLWCDEIEKAISGVRSSGQTDGGTTSRVLSTFLTWMQEKESPVFVVATANDHASIPAEFLRAGRFDEIMFVGLPNYSERKEIFKVILHRKRQEVSRFDLSLLSQSSDKYSGAEIEKAIDKSMLKGFLDHKRQINDEDILKSLKEFKPLSVMREGDFQEILEWAKSNCVMANEEVEKNKENIYSQKVVDMLDISDEREN